MIVAVRHGPVVAARLCYGRWDPPLVHPVGHDAAIILERLQAAATGSAVRGTPPAPLPRPRRIVSSPAGRCHAVAAQLALRLGLPLCVDDRLVELSMGEWEGRSWAEIEASDGTRLATWMHDWESVAPPGGETLADLEVRVRSATEETTQPTLWLTHAGVIRALRVLLTGWAWTAAMRTPVEHLRPEPFGTISPEIQQGPRPAVTATAPRHGTGASNP